MKYRKKGIKREHHIIEDGEELLEDLIKKKLVKSIIPGRIKKNDTERSAGDS